MRTSSASTIVIALGGSIIVPKKIQTRFLKKFKKFILSLLKENKRFVIVTGGGNVARSYINAATAIVRTTNDDKDWLGIHATRINAHLLRTIFKDVAYPVILDNPFRQITDKNYRLFIASGWRPGWSTDYDAVLLAQRFNADKIIVASKISYVHERDIAIDKSAKPMKEISWTNYRKLISSEWRPGMTAPVDPVAARLAAKLKMILVVTKGTNLKNLKKIINGEKFQGTIIHP